MTTSNTELDLGLRFIVEPAGFELTDNEAKQLADLRPAGIMLRKRNFKHGEPYEAWLNKYKVLLSQCRQAIGRESIIISVDHEGGGVHRFPEPITRFPYAATYGASSECVFQVASMMAEELVSLGINVSFSPVADIHSNPQNPVINERAFATTAAQVATAAIACARALRQNGVIPCAKHFPGHGDTASDSHYSLPHLHHTKEQLQLREFMPFKALIADGIELIMTAHIMVPGIDPENQATVSKAILTDLLRGEFGFQGLTIADALGMSAINSTVKSDEFAVKAHRAGLDLFLFVGDNVSIADAITLRDRLAVAVNNSELTAESLLQSESRIKKFLSTLPQNQIAQLNETALAKHSHLAKQLRENAPWSEFNFAPKGFD
jgi:beta-N-acetylhexosaminidase